jgi:hypothetical protein
MDTFEDAFQHPVIVCAHNLDVSVFEYFASQLANRLILNVEMQNHKNSYLKTIHNTFAINKAQLIEKKSSVLPAMRYELVLNDVSLIFYDDFIEISISFDLDYYHLLQLYQKNELKTIFFFNTLFNQLKLLGIEEVHFGIFSEAANGEYFKYCWENIFQDLINNHKHFKLTL